MDHAVDDDDDDDFDGNIFIYRGRRPAPLHVTHARIDESVDGIEDHAFRNCHSLLTVDTHDGLRRVGKWAFYNCTSLRRINLKSAIEIGFYAFNKCESLADVEFGDRLETIEEGAFEYCTFNRLKLQSATTIGSTAFYSCRALIDVELSERLETIGTIAFWCCERLRRIAVPLKRDLFVFDDINREYNQFDGCNKLITVDLVGGIHKTVASLHMENWKTEILAEINRINQVLPSTRPRQKGGVIRQWMESLLDKMDHYKAEHCRYMKEGITLLELALWKAKLGEKEAYAAEGKTKKAKVHAESYRRDKRITCGADLVIKNVLPFLQLE